MKILINCSPTVFKGDYISASQSGVCCPYTVACYYKCILTPRGPLTSEKDQRSEGENQEKVWGHEAGPGWGSPDHVDPAGHRVRGHREVSWGQDRGLLPPHSGAGPGAFQHRCTGENTFVVDIQENTRTNSKFCFHVTYSAYTYTLFCLLFISSTECWNTKKVCSHFRK